MKKNLKMCPLIVILSLFILTFLGIANAEGELSKPRGEIRVVESWRPAVNVLDQSRGKYFYKKQYIPEPLPIFAENRDRLPAPILKSNPEWIDMYWKCWQIAFEGFKQPPKGSPLVSNWLDEAFSRNIFQWDTIFMMMFARYGHDVFPAIQSMDNFYCLQRKSGYICREYREEDGKMIHFDFKGGLFSLRGWKNTINPPLFS